MMHGNAKLSNGDSAAFWAGAADGKLIFQQCEPCGHVQFPPRHQCAICWSDRLRPLEGSGVGVIESATVVRRAPVAAFRSRVPYVVASIRTAEGPRMITNIVGADALDAAIGDRVSVCFDREQAGETLPQFRLVR